MNMKYFSLFAKHLVRAINGGTRRWSRANTTESGHKKSRAAAYYKLGKQLDLLETH